VAGAALSTRPPHPPASEPPIPHLIADGVERAFGDRQILQGASLRLQAGDRVGLVGANGSGKTTLLSILAGTDPDHGGSVHREGRLAVLHQEPVLHGDTVADAVSHAVAWHRQLVADYERAVADGDLDEATALQDRLDHHGWAIDHKVEAVLDRVGAPAMHAPTATLSGGERRRIALALCLLSAPDILLLDEPTNHLDADVVEWLEGYLSGFRGALLLVTHDRYLLEAVAETIVEVEDGRCVTYEGSYGDYLVARAERQARRAAKRQRLLQLVASEAAWAARSPSARSTKQKARLQRLDSLREQVPTLEDRSLSFDLRTGVHQGATLLELHGVSKAYDQPLFTDLDLVLRPGDRVGIMGPNGAGKSTLLRILRRQETPDRGELLVGPRARLGVLDQQRSGLRDEDTVFEAAGDGNDRVPMGDGWIHVAGFLERFAFTRDHFDQAVAALSGGERARLLLARLMLKGATVLLLDEPTNDLDLLTLRVLEEALLAYDGGVIVVTHDRAFLDRVATRVVAFEGDGVVQTYASRLQAVNAARERARAASEAEAEAARAAPVPSNPSGRAPKPARLSYADKQELAALPERIEALEDELAAVEARLADPALYRDEPEAVPELSRRAGELPTEIEQLFTRWEALAERG